MGKISPEYVLRNRLGLSFAQASRTMARRRNVAEVILEIISTERLLWGANPYPEYNLPTEYLRNMDFFVNAEIAVTRGEPPFHFDETQYQYLDSLIVYVQMLYMTYGELWENFARMEQDADMSLSSRPDLAVSDLELNLLADRASWSKETRLAGGAMDMFLQNTMIGQLLMSKTHEQLFDTTPPPTNRSVSILICGKGKS